MSIIIRLQNLPLSARSGDIRKFFGGLRIPDGGVHILGGDKGDAFIAFMSDEDARLAMRKDGGRIKDSRIKLFLSSRMEMQHEVEKVTHTTLTDVPFLKDHTSEMRMRTPERRRLSRSRSPHSRSPHSRSPQSYRSRSMKDRRRSMSPYNPKGSSPIIYGSRSPRRRSRSPVDFSPPRLPSFKSKSFVPKRKSTSPKGHGYNLHTTPLKNVPHLTWENPDSQFSSKSAYQAELEKRITEELEKSSFLKNLNAQENISRKFLESHQNIQMKKEPDDFMFFSHSSNSSSTQHFQNTEFKRNSTVNRIKQEPMSSDASCRSNKEKHKFTDGYFISLSGMDPLWSFREVQLILKGFFAPQNNIRLEKDEAGYKTGTAFVKLSNKEDFETVTKKAAFYFNSHKITVSECPNFIAQKYFQSNSNMRNDYIPQNRDLCYILKGLPFSCKYNDIITFFHGYEISDVIVFYGEDGRAMGTGFVSFTNWKDFEGAISLNGKKIGHRYIEMLPSTDKEMAEAKETQPGGIFVPYSKLLSEKKLPGSRRPLCALLTGLPLNINTKKILNFFAESGLKPAAVHLTLSKKRLCDGRAFVEFTNFIDFDLALKFHGKRIDNNIVCVKQILYDEMVKILDSQKAKHYFETQTASTTVLSEPEKVPYLWEPPDEEQVKDLYSKDKTIGPMPDKLPSNSIPSVFPQNKNLGGFPKNNIFERKFNPNQVQAVTNRMTDILQQPSVHHSDFRLSSYNTKSRNTGNFAQNSVPFNSSKQFGIAVPSHQAFHSTKKYEENIKSSKLSPENEAALLSFLNKDRKSLPGWNNRRSRSQEKKGRNLNADRFFDEAKESYENEREFRRYDVAKYDFHDRSPTQSNPLHFNNDKGPEEEKCVVELTNVDVSISTRDLINFLLGFDFDENTLIRRYTSEGEPTPDVRVTFSDMREAKRAIRILNKRTLRNKRVTMFLV